MIESPLRMEATIQVLRIGVTIVTRKWKSAFASFLMMGTSITMSKFNWESTGPDGCDDHCIEHPCGPCITGYRSAEAYEKAQEQEECPHDELDHGVCLSCGKDCFDDVIDAAEYYRDCMEDR